MNTQLTPKTKYSEAISSLWFNWTMPVGAVVLVIVLSLWMSPGLLPAVAIALGVVFASYARSNVKCSLRCSLVAFLVSRALVVSGMAMILMMLLFKYYGVPGWLGDLNPRHPYIPVLLLAPATLAFSGYARARGRNFSHCTACLISRGLPAEQGFIGRTIGQEGRFQVVLLFRLSLLITVVTWVYYFTAYINVNLNSPDKLVFVWLPVILYGISVLFMGVRYISLLLYYSRDFRGESVDFGESTSLRYLIFDNRERIYLAPESGDGVDTSVAIRYDTPAAFSFSKRKSIPLDEAERMFRKFVPSEADCSVRFMYESHTASEEANMFHFIVTVHNPDILPESDLKGEWYTLSQLDRFLNSGRLNSMLAAEIYRLHTITMAWKSYDRQGRRLYRIKHYRPVFRLKGIQDWDVDFNDPEWLKVAHNNEDRPFFRLRRWWMNFAHGRQG